MHATIRHTIRKTCLRLSAFPGAGLATVSIFMITIVKLFSPEPRPIVPAARGRVGLCSGSRERAARSWIFPTSQLRSPAAVKACFVHHGESSHSQFRCTCNCTFAQSRAEGSGLMSGFILLQISTNTATLCMQSETSSYLSLQTGSDRRHAIFFVRTRE